jgi:hypothetical protein
MSRLAQYTQLKLKFDNCVNAKDEEQANLLLDEMDEIFDCASDHEKAAIRALFKRQDCKS